MAPAVEYTHTQASRAFLSTVCFVRVDKGEESYVGEESYIHKKSIYIFELRYYHSLLRLLVAYCRDKPH